MTTPKSTITSALSRRTLIVNGAAMAAVAALPGKSTATQKEETMSTASATQQGGAQAGEKAAIRPFTVPIVSDADLADLRKRISATRWPDKEQVSDDTQGVQLATAQKLARYWGT